MQISVLLLLQNAYFCNRPGLKMKSTDKYICIHGHFYQPPRENAWLEAIETQDTASPFHDWNQRINFECYAPNTSARILDENGRISRIINNYAKISFNFGPTLLSWLQTNDAESYRLILEGDKIAQQNNGGFGSAIAQIYNHVIMPLANRQDKITQVKWGIRDFENRFGRKPDGMWLAETAVDTETLEILAEAGIRFTILAPRQVKAFRKQGESEWTIKAADSRRPYLFALPSGKKMGIFVYDGDASHSIAFNGLLNSGKAFAAALLDRFSPDSTAELVNVATDGESYGHHHRHGEMALADCIDIIENMHGVQLCNYAHYLDLFPPEYELQIHENSSWSCVHGIERWRSDCGCNSDGKGYHQRWRAPLRETLDWLRDELLPFFESEASKYVTDAWAARNAYIDVMMDRSPSSIEVFLEQFARRALSKEETVCVLRLFEMQRNALLMFTSCGWFFDEVSGLETRQILQYACRAIDYAAQLQGPDLHSAFEKKLAVIPGNEYENCAIAYRKLVLPGRVNLERVGMHVAAASLFEKFPESFRVFNYHARTAHFERQIEGNQRLVVGQTTVQSAITTSEKQFSFIALYLGQHNIIGNLSTEIDSDSFILMKEKALSGFKKGNLGDVITLMQTFFGLEKFTIQDLFYDEKRTILNLIAELQLKSVESSLRELYIDNYQLMSTMLDNNLPVPDAFRSAVGYVLNRDLEHFFENEQLNLKDLERMLEERGKWGIRLSHEATFELAASERIYREVRKVENNESAVPQLNMINSVLEILNRYEVKLDIWKSQNAVYHILKSGNNAQESILSEEWKSNFFELAQMLNVKY